MTNYESIYPGINYLTLMPSYYYPPISGYRVSAGELGAAVDPRTANQLGELNIKLNPGVKTIEIQGISAQTLESIPEQHLDEIKRLSKLTGVKPTLHGPLLEASGIGREGWTEEQRIGVEKQMESAVLRAHKMDPQGNIPVTFHSTAELPELRPHIKSDKEGKREKIGQGLYIVNEDTGQIGMIKPEKRYLGEGEFTGKELKFEAEKELERRNKETWTENLSQINLFADRGEEALRGAERQFPEIYQQFGKLNKELIKGEEDRKSYEDAERTIKHGQIYLRDSYRSLRQLFDRAWSSADEEEKKKLKEFAEFAAPKISRDFETDPEKIQQLRQVVERGLDALSGLKPPQIFTPLDNFVVKKSAQTFANVAESAYNKFGDTAPIISIENPPAGGGISTGEDLKKLVISSREQLAKNLVENKGFSNSEANQIAEKMIGATWDVGHINMLRKKGYTEKEIVEETKKIAPYVKHVHLSDNFGLDHTELPMGMGNVPLKPMMEELKRAGFKGKEIIEAGNWWQYFAEHGGGNPFKPSIEAFDSPIYAMETAPTWSQTGIYGAYFSGHGPINPPVHHNIYGAGFQTLPVELGGEIQTGEKGRFAGGASGQ
ncbi:MAG: TIM barrel protein [Nanoarchaeota archaeon]